MSDELLLYIKQSQIRASFLVATILTFGLAGIPWLFWEIFKKRSHGCAGHE